MSEIPFTIPSSLVSYVIQYETSPDKAIRRLENQLKKRGADPVGYFFLAWFYHRKKWKQKAIRCALKARNHATGSPFLKNLHYYFAHPDVFEAWQPHTKTFVLKGPITSFSGYESVEELEILIEKLSAFDETDLKKAVMNRSEPNSTLSSSSINVNDIASETLAEIHEKQGKPEAAIEIYQKLMKTNHKRRGTYKRQIERIKKEIEEKANR